MSRRILIVDDSQLFRESARQLLAMGGFEVAAAVGDGDAARAAIEDGCPDGVLLDVNLPGEDGFAIAAWLSRLCPSVRIVLTSSEVALVPDSALRGCGAAAFVPKTELATTELGVVFGL